MSLSRAGDGSLTYTQTCLAPNGTCRSAARSHNRGDRQVIANGRRIGDGGRGAPITEASCAFRASISLASSTEANSSARLATMAEIVCASRREPASADVVEQVGIGQCAVLWRLQWALCGDSSGRGQYKNLKNLRLGLYVVISHLPR